MTECWRNSLFPFSSLFFPFSSLITKSTAPLQTAGAPSCVYLWPASEIAASGWTTAAAVAATAAAAWSKRAGNIPLFWLYLTLHSLYSSPPWGSWPEKWKTNLLYFLHACERSDIGGGREKRLIVSGKKGGKFEICMAEKGKAIL